ncbi:MAG: hypothetical protein HZB50_02960 [Chloroflexi bacterium]|nr:hypothetical protein [Chloroflexota bacterium]
MKQPLFTLIGTLLFVVMLAGCGSAPEQVATMTTSAWTSTPLITSTPSVTPSPTPVPVDLQLTVFDENGMPIEGADILFPESRYEKPVQTDGQGKHNWKNLPSNMATLIVSAQGYFLANQQANLRRGPNEVEIVLMRDPFGLLPSDGCGVEGKLLYMEDFQDTEAQEWGNVPINWSILNEDGNNILSIFAVSDMPPYSGAELAEYYKFDNFVWHSKLKIVGSDTNIFFDYRVTHPDKDTRYRMTVSFGAKDKTSIARFWDTATSTHVNNFGINGASLKSGKWYDISIANFNGLHQVWYDGKEQIQYQEMQPYPAGSIAIEPLLEAGSTTQFFLDDLVVCELSAPYSP